MSIGLDVIRISFLLVHGRSLCITAHIYVFQDYGNDAAICEPMRNGELGSKAETRGFEQVRTLYFAKFYFFCKAIDS